MKKIITLVAVLLVTMSLFAAPAKIEGIDGVYNYEDEYTLTFNNNRIYVVNDKGRTVNVGVYGQVADNKYLCKLTNTIFDLKGDKLVNIFTKYYSIYSDIKSEKYQSAATELAKIGDHNILEYVTLSLTRDKFTGNLVVYLEGTSDYPSFLVGILNINTDDVRTQLSDNK